MAMVRKLAPAEKDGLGELEGVETSSGCPCVRRLKTAHRDHSHRPRCIGRWRGPARVAWLPRSSRTLRKASALWVDTSNSIVAVLVCANWHSSVGVLGASSGRSVTLDRGTLGPLRGDCSRGMAILDDLQRRAGVFP